MHATSLQAKTCDKPITAVTVAAMHARGKNHNSQPLQYKTITAEHDFFFTEIADIMFGHKKHPQWFI